MDTIKTGHERPVDLVSSRMLWKAPWWAHAPEPVRKAILSIPKPNTWEAWVDYTKPPPRQPSNCQPITNRIGHRVQYINRGERGSIYTIIGYSRKVGYVKTVFQGTRPPWWIGPGWDSKKLTKRTIYDHIWWAVREDGELMELRFRNKGNKYKSVDTE